MTRDGRRPPTSRYGQAWLELRADPGKPPPTGPKDTRPPRGPEQPTRPHPQDPDKLPDPRPGRVLATIVGLLLLARHRAPADEPLGQLGRKLAGGRGVWDVPRDDTPAPTWPGGKRPPLRDNLEDPK